MYEDVPVQVVLMLSVVESACLTEGNIESSVCKKTKNQTKKSLQLVKHGNQTCINVNR